MAVVVLAVVAAWSQGEHEPAAAVDATYAFLRTARQKTPWLARCHQASSFDPYQTRGNRLRRRLQGRDPDPQEVSVDFADCSVRFFLRGDSTGAWTVYRVHPHAG